MGVIAFCKYSILLVNTFIDVTDSNDLVLSLGLYVIYPAILYLLIDKFHGVCGRDTYLKKAEAIDACNSIFLWFTTLLRTSKLIYIIIFSVDADYKSGSRRHLDVEDDTTNPSTTTTTRNTEPPPSSGTITGGLLGKLKCQTWMHLTQELSIIGFVSFLLIVCLPVLAFWTMFVSILMSLWSLVNLAKRIWKDAHEATGGQANNSRRGEENNEDDVEFQEFLSNFADDTKDQST
jgi:hypothetical protein